MLCPNKRKIGYIKPNRKDIQIYFLDIKLHNNSVFNSIHYYLNSKSSLKFNPFSHRSSFVTKL